MSLTAWSIFEIRADGDTLNAGAFEPTSASNTSVYSATLSTANGTSDTPTVTASNYTFVASDVGHWLYIHAGTSWQGGWYRIQSVAGGSATVDARVNRFGALNQGLRWWQGVATTASASSGQWSIDYSQSPAAHRVYTDLAIQSTNTDVVSAAFPFGPNHVGNCVRVLSGTGFTVGRYRIVSIPTGNVARLSSAVGTALSTGGGGRLGGAVNHPTGHHVNGSLVFVRAGTYNYDMSLAVNTPGGRSDVPATFIGYGTDRWDFGTRPMLRATVNAASPVGMMAGSFLFFDLDMAGLTNVNGFHNARCHLCRAYNSAPGRAGFWGGQAFYCLAENPAQSGGRGFDGGTVYCLGRRVTFGTAMHIHSIAEDCSWGFAEALTTIRCLAVRCSRPFVMGWNDPLGIRLAINNLSVGHTFTDGGFWASGVAQGRSLVLGLNNAAFGAGPGFELTNTRTAGWWFGNIPLTADPTQDSAGRNYRLARNATGALLRGTGYDPELSFGVARAGTDIGVFAEPYDVPGLPAGRAYNSGG